MLKRKSLAAIKAARTALINQRRLVEKVGDSPTTPDGVAAAARAKRLQAGIDAATRALKKARR